MYVLAAKKAAEIPMILNHWTTLTSPPIKNNNAITVNNTETIKPPLIDSAALLKLLSSLLLAYSLKCGCIISIWNDQKINPALINKVAINNIHNTLVFSILLQNKITMIKLITIIIDENTRLKNIFAQAMFFVSAGAVFNKTNSLPSFVIAKALEVFEALAIIKIINDVNTTVI